MKDKGLYDKYEVQRKDGKDLSGPVLIIELGKDPQAKDILESLLEIWKDTRPKLVSDLKEWAKHLYPELNKTYIYLQEYCDNEGEEFGIFFENTQINRTYLEYIYQFIKDHSHFSENFSLDLSPLSLKEINTINKHDKNLYMSFVNMPSNDSLERYYNSLKAIERDINNGILKEGEIAEDHFYNNICSWEIYKLSFQDYITKEYVKFHE